MEKNLSDILFGRHIKKSGIKRKHDTPQKPSKIHTITTTTTTYYLYEACFHSLISDLVF